MREPCLYRAVDKHVTPIDFLLTAKRDLEAAKRFFRKMLQDEPLLAPDRIGTDGVGLYPPAITAARKDGPAVGDKEDVIITCLGAAALLQQESLAGNRLLPREDGAKAT